MRSAPRSRATVGSAGVDSRRRRGSWGRGGQWTRIIEGSGNVPGPDARCSVIRRSCCVGVCASMVLFPSSRATRPSSMDTFGVARWHYCSVGASGSSFFWRCLWVALPGDCGPGTGKVFLHQTGSSWRICYVAARSHISFTRHAAIARIHQEVRSATVCWRHPVQFSWTRVAESAPVAVWRQGQFVRPLRGGPGRGLVQSSPME